MKKPLCKYCKARHSLSEPHVFKGETWVPPRQPLPNPALVLKKIREMSDEERERLKAQYVVTEPALKASNKCPTCGRVLRQKRYASDAEKQRAYRERKKG
jgi:uncharacterized C2H2 Zn-finger protein